MASSQDIDEVSSAADGRPMSTRREYETPYDQAVKEMEEKVQRYNLHELYGKCVLMDCNGFRTWILPLMFKTVDRYREDRPSANELKKLFMHEYADTASEVAHVFWFHDDCRHNEKPGKRNQCFAFIFAHILEQESGHD